MTANVTTDGLSRAQARLAALEPQPLTARPLPEYPVTALPAWLRDMVAATAEAMQVPLALPGMTALGVLAACAAGRAEVEVRRGWVETLSLFTLTVAESSERKSPTHRVLVAPLRAAERQLVASSSEDRSRLMLDREMAQRQAEAAKEAALRASTATPAPSEDKLRHLMAEAVDAQAIADALESPLAPRLLAGGDSTPEAIVQLLCRHGRIAIVEAEGGLFDQLAGRHNSGRANLDAVLQAYSGDPIAVERRGRDPEFVARPALAITLAVQPLTLARVVGDPDMTGRGLVGRFLMAVPAPMVGRRRTGRDVVPIPGPIEAEYDRLLQRLAVDLAGWTDPAQLRFTETALDLVYQWEKDVEQQLARGGRLRPTGAWGGKLVGQAVRLAALLHLAQHGGGQGPRTPIDAPAVNAALQLGEFFAQHALAGFGGGGEADTSAAAEALAKLRSSGLEVFTIRDLHRRLRSARFSQADAVRDAVDVLEETGHVARIDTAGRTYVVRPERDT